MLLIAQERLARITPSFEVFRNAWDLYVPYAGMDEGISPTNLDTVR